MQTIRSSKVELYCAKYILCQVLPIAVCPTLSHYLTSLCLKVGIENYIYSGSYCLCATEAAQGPLRLQCVLTWMKEPEDDKPKVMLLRSSRK